MPDLEAPQKVIIDTDPGVDDIFAISLALAHPELLDVVAITTTHGTTDVESCTKNVRYLLRILHRTSAFYETNNESNMFAKPSFVAMGASRPFSQQSENEASSEKRAEGYHGWDGLNGFHSRNPNRFNDEFDSNHVDEKDLPIYPLGSAHLKILDTLRNHEPKTISIIAIGPTTNLALALAADPCTFSRVKQIVMMGGALRCSGNVTPRAEANIYADPDAAASIFDLSSPSRPSSIGGPVRVVLVPLDITAQHAMTETVYKKFISPPIRAGNPLALFLDDVLEATFNKVQNITGRRIVGCSDPLTVSTLLWPELMRYEKLNIKVETTGTWTKGECVVDFRGRKKQELKGEDIPEDFGGWVYGTERNDVDVLISSGIEPTNFGETLLRGIFRNAQSN
ncbi:hypothetical protein B7463_g3348, partial [Scytalidium lignicola]